MARRALQVVLVQVSTSLPAAMDAAAVYDMEALYDGTEGQLLFSDNPWADPAVGAFAEARLGGEITFQRRLTTIYWGGGRSQAGIGDIELVNNDGALDHLVFAGLRGAGVLVFLGDDRTGWYDLSLVGRGQIERVDTAGERALRLIVGDAASELARHIETPVFETATANGRRAPVAFGQPSIVPPVPYDMPNLRWAVHNDADYQVLAVYDQGVMLIGGIDYDLADDPGTGFFGFEKLAATAGRITASVAGGLYHPAAVNPSEGRNVAAHAFTLAGVAWDPAELSALQSKLGIGWQLGHWVDNATTFAEVMDLIADSCGGYWHSDLNGRVRLWPLEPPSAPAVLSITEDELVDDVQVRFDDAPGLAATVAGGKNFHVHSDSELAGAVRDGVAGAALRADFRIRRSFEPHPVYARATAARGASRLAGVATWGRQGEGAAYGAPSRSESDEGHGTILLDPAGVEDERDRRAALWGEPRYWYEATVELGVTQAASLELASVVALTVTDRRTGSPRYGLQNRLLRVIAVEGAFGSGQVRLKLWGGGPPPEPPSEEGEKT